MGGVKGNCGFRIAGAAALALLAAGGAGAMEGVPYLQWFTGRTSLEEGRYAVSARAEGAVESGYAGGTGERSMKAARYLMAPICARYGVIEGLEFYSVLPFYWGESPQRYVNYSAVGGTEEYSAVISGADFGDIDTLFKWRAWEDEGRNAAVLLHAGAGYPTGTDVWNGVMYNFITGPAKPRMAQGDGALKLMAGAGCALDGESFRFDALAGYIWRLGFEATALEPSGSTIDVQLPSPVVGWVRPEWRVLEDWWLSASLEGFWAPAGRVTSGGLLAKEEGSLGKVLDSYMNLVRSSAGLWAGLGASRALTSEVTLSAGAKAPVMVDRLYRLWRAELTVTYSGKP